MSEETLEILIKKALEYATVQCTLFALGREYYRKAFFMRYKAAGLTGGSSDICLNTVDIMPTLLTMMGLPVPSEVEGQDCSKALLGQGGAEPEDEGRYPGDSFQAG